MSQIVKGSSHDLPPALLYKYRAFDEPNGKKLRDIIVGNELFAASPASFNDPYDCMPVLDPSSTRAERKALLETHVARQLASMPPIKHRWQARKLRKQVRDAFQRQETPAFQREAWLKTISNMGVISLAEEPTSMLLWSHYAGNHTGVCLEFTTVLRPFVLAHRVQYKNERPTFRIFDPEKPNIFFNVLLRKSPDWEYEQEWRIFEANCAGPVQFASTALKTVILGSRISTEHEDAVRQMVASRSSVTTLARAVLDDRAYKMKIIR